MKNKNLTWRFLFDLNLCLTGAAAYKWITLGNSWAFLYLVSMSLLITGFNKHNKTKWTC